MPFRHLGQRARAFARGEDDEPTARRRFRQRRRQAMRRVRGRDSGAEQRFEQFMRLRSQDGTELEPKIRAAASYGKNATATLSLST